MELALKTYSGSPYSLRLWCDCGAEWYYEGELEVVKRLIGEWEIKHHGSGHNYAFGRYPQKRA